MGNPLINWAALEPPVKFDGTYGRNNLTGYDECPVITDVNDNSIVVVYLTGPEGVELAWDIVNMINNCHPGGTPKQNKTKP